MAHLQRRFVNLGALRGPERVPASVALGGLSRRTPRDPLAARRRAAGIQMEMLVGEQAGRRHAATGSGREEKPDQPVSEQPKVPDVRGCSSEGVGSRRRSSCSGTGARSRSSRTVAPPARCGNDPWPQQLPAQFCRRRRAELSGCPRRAERQARAAAVDNESDAAENRATFPFAGEEAGCPGGLKGPISRPARVMWFVRAPRRWRSVPRMDVAESRWFST